MSWLALETDLECIPEIYDLSQGPQLFPLYLPLVMPIEALMGLPLVNTFSAYVEKWERVWKRPKTMCQRTRFLFLI